MTPRGGAAILVVLAVLGGAAFAEPGGAGAGPGRSARAGTRGARAGRLRAGDDGLPGGVRNATRRARGCCCDDLGQAYGLAGDCAAAASSYRRYLAADGEPAARSLAATQLAPVEVCVAAARPVAAPVAVRAVAPAGGRGLRRAGLGLAGGGGVSCSRARPSRSTPTAPPPRSRAATPRAPPGRRSPPPTPAGGGRARSREAGAVITGALRDLGWRHSLLARAARARGAPIVTGSVGARAARMELTWQF